MKYKWEQDEGDASSWNVEGAVWIFNEEKQEITCEDERDASNWNVEGVVWIFNEEGQEITDEDEVRDILWKIEVDLSCIFIYAQHVLVIEV